MPKTFFHPFLETAYPCYGLSVDGEYMVNEAAKLSTDSPLNPENVKLLLEAAAAMLSQTASDDASYISTMTGAIRLSGLTMLPFEEGLVAVATQVHQFPVTAFSSQFRDPLTDIFAVLPLLNRRLENPDEKYVDEIQQGCYKLLRLVNNIENVSRLEDQHFDLKTIDLRDLVDSLCFCANSICKEQGVIIETRLPEHPVPIKANARLLADAVLNILRNSFQYTRDHNQILARLSVVGKQAVLTIEDKGLGIKPENVTHIFDYYFSAEPYADGEAAPGLGLGLTVVRGVANSFGGTVTAESRFGEGTRITMAFPLDESGDIALGSDKADYLLNRYSQIYVQLSGYCRLPTM